MIFLSNILLMESSTCQLIKSVRESETIYKYFNYF